MTAVAAPGPGLMIVVTDVVAADPLLQRHRSYVLLTLTGSLTGKDSDHLYRELQRFSAGRSTHLLLDLSAISRIDQDGLDAVRRFAHHLDTLDRWLTITAAPTPRRSRHRPAHPNRAAPTAGIPVTRPDQSTV